MAKITDLAAVEAITGDEFLPIVQRGATKRATMSALRALIVPYLQAWYKGDKGDPGAAGNVAATIAQLRAAAISAATMIAAYDGSGSPMTWTAGDFTTLALQRPQDYVQRDGVPLSTGAWVRQQDTATLFLQEGPGAVPRSSRDKARDSVSVKDFGAKGDTIALTGGTMANGGKIVTVAGATFAAGDVGKRIAVLAPGFTLVSSITEVTSATVVTIATPAPRAIAGADVVYGTDDTAAIQAALAAHACVEFPSGTYFHGRLTLKFDKQVLRGKSIEATKLFCPVGYAITNFSGLDSDPIGPDWVGAPVIEHMRIAGGFRHADKFAAPENSWAFSTGRGKPFTAAGVNAGIRLKRCHPYTLRNVWIEHFHRGVYLSAAALGRWQDFRVAHCEYGVFGENGAVWGDPAWQVTTHNWMDGRFSECWIGIGGSDYVQCQVQKKTVDFEPCNTGIAIFNGGDNVWSGYYELCSEGIYRNGSFMGHDVIEDAFFGGRPDAFWGMGDSILLDAGIGATGSVTLRNGLTTPTGGGIRVLGGRLSRPEIHVGTLGFLATPVTPAGGYVDTALPWVMGSGYDDARLLDPATPTEIRIPPEHHGAKVRLVASLTIAGDAVPNDVSAWFERNGLPFAGNGRFAQIYTYGLHATVTSAPIVVSAGDIFRAVVKMNLPREIGTGGECWLSVEIC